MGYLIDTNVLSELQKGQKANPGVLLWYNNIIVMIFSCPCWWLDNSIYGPEKALTINASLP